MKRNIAVINRSTVVPDTLGQIYTEALQIQVSQHWAPIWGDDARLVFYGQNHTPPANWWWLVLIDDSDTAGAAGYHDLTPAGLPLGKAFAKTVLQFNGSVSVTMSHELLEMIQDPDINQLAEFDRADGSPAKLYAYEVCDSCEDDQFGYKIEFNWNGAPQSVLVSDFVYPDFFVQQPPPGAQFDHQRKIARPFSLLPGGYLSVLDLGNLAQGWQQITAADALAMRMSSGQEESQTGCFPTPPDCSRTSMARPRVGSRRERRMIPRADWVRSCPKDGL